jgi:hypothetical protein
MPTMQRPSDQPAWPTLYDLPRPVKVLLSAILITLSLAMVGALGQVIVHDIIPTFFTDEAKLHGDMEAVPNDVLEPGGETQARGDLFGDDSTVHSEPETKSLMDNEQFIWTLRWTHIHLFGMCMIFILLGVVTVFLDISVAARNWLIALPFVGVVVDIAAMWLKAFVSPAFFWLHIPGGGLFAGIFVFIFFRAMGEMWSAHDTRSRRSKSN